MSCKFTELVQNRTKAKKYYLLDLNEKKVIPSFKLQMQKENKIKKCCGKICYLGDGIKTSKVEKIELSSEDINKCE